MTSIEREKPEATTKEIQTAHDKFVIQQLKESKLRTEENKDTLMKSGVVKCFQKAIDETRVILSSQSTTVEVPQYQDNGGEKRFVGNKEDKLSYTPAIIVWGRECQTISLFFDQSRHGVNDGNPYSDHLANFYKHCTFAVLNDKKVGINPYYLVQQRVPDDNCYSKADFIGGFIPTEKEDIPRVIEEYLTNKTNIK